MRSNRAGFSMIHSQACLFLAIDNLQGNIGVDIKFIGENRALALLGADHQRFCRRNDRMSSLSSAAPTIAADLGVSIPSGWPAGQPLCAWRDQSARQC